MADLAVSSAVFLIFIWELTEQNCSKYCASCNFFVNDTRLNSGKDFNIADSMMFDAVGED